MRVVNYLGFTVGERCIKTNDKAVEPAIRKYPKPKTPKQVRRRITIGNFSILSSSLHELTMKNKMFEMMHDARDALDKIQIALTTGPILIHSNYSKPFIVQCDVFTSGIGAILCQADNEVERAIYYVSHELRELHRI